MSNKLFSESIQQKLKESGAFSFGLNKQPEIPVQQASWPSQQEELPSTTQTNVTNGESTVMGEPRTDLAAQNCATNIDQEVMAEISSLLISIGYILSTAGAVPDKFNTDAVLKVLNDKFSGGNQLAPTVSVEPVVQPVEPQVIDMTPTGAFGVSSYMEQRKLLESKFKKTT